MLSQETDLNGSGSDSTHHGSSLLRREIQSYSWFDDGMRIVISAPILENIKADKVALKAGRFFRSMPTTMMSTMMFTNVTCMRTF